MLKSKKKVLFLILIIFSSFCAISIGYSWDEGFLIRQGEITANYLLSLGLVDPDNLFRREFYSPIYYAIRYLLVQAIPKIYQIEANQSYIATGNYFDSKFIIEDMPFCMSLIENFGDES